MPKSHSFFLFGPRGVGKSTLLREILASKETYLLDLLDFELETHLLKQPSRFREIIETLPDSIKWIIVDEIQKIPQLLDEVHRQIEQNKKRHFALTGSSARKLKRGKANLLAGRAFSLKLHPLTMLEIKNNLLLNEILAYGSLPEVLSTPDIADRIRFLKTYAQTYLKEEILAEGIIRNLPAFRNFLVLAAQSNGQLISWSHFAQDTGIDAKTIRSYFEVLTDTLIGFILPAYARSLRTQQRKHPKFYFFDLGVKRALAGELTLPLLEHTTEYGRSFEHFCIIELMRLNDYFEWDYKFSYFATQDVEIDLVIERPGKKTLFVEVKASRSITEAKLGRLSKLVSEQKNSSGLCFSREKIKRQHGNILICPWQEMAKVIEELK